MGSSPLQVTDPFIAHPPSAPLLDKAAAMCGQGIQSFMDWLIHEKIGGALDAATCAIKDMGKGPLLSLGNGNLAGAIDGISPSATPKVPNVPQKGEGQAIERSIIPEKAIVQAQSIGSASGMKVDHVHVADGTIVCPTCTPSMGASRGHGISMV